MTISEDEGAPLDSHRTNLKVVKFQVLRLTLTDNENEVVTDSGGMQVPMGTGQWNRFPQGTIV